MQNLFHFFTWASTVDITVTHADRVVLLQLLITFHNLFQLFYFRRYGECLTEDALINDGEYSSADPLFTAHDGEYSSDDHMVNDLGGDTEELSVNYGPSGRKSPVDPGPLDGPLFDPVDDPGFCGSGSSSNQFSTSGQPGLGAGAFVDD